MAHYEKLYWEPDYDAPSTRLRKGGTYSAYVPDPLCDRAFVFSAETVSALNAAESAIKRLNEEETALSNTEGLARLLIRAEALSSSRIEGLSIGARRLMKAELNTDHIDVTAREVMNNIDAMNAALAMAQQDDSITVDTFCKMHKEMLKLTRLDEHAGKIRSQQNWVGGNDYNPCDAIYVPPAPERVLSLMEDLAEFCNRDTLPPLVQAAIAHAQFETIHPFVDGNGRVGRALIHLILRKRGLCSSVVPPLSLIIATQVKSYSFVLSEYRYDGESDSQAAQTGMQEIVEFFAECARQACRNAFEFEGRAAGIRQEWLAKLGHKPTPGEIAVSRAITGLPLFTADSITKITGKSAPTVYTAIKHLEEIGAVKQTNVGRRNRAYEAIGIIEAFTDFERQLASPEYDTKIAAPARAVPARPQQS